MGHSAGIPGAGAIDDCDLPPESGCINLYADASWHPPNNHYGTNPLSEKT